MAPTFLTTLTTLTALLALAIAAPAPAAVAARAESQTLHIVYTAGHFSSIAGIGHSSGFSIIDTNGNTVWEDAYPAGYSPCGRDRKFALSGSCLNHPREFHCDADFGGLPAHCGVSDVGVGMAIEADGAKSTNFIGISTSVDGMCSFDFVLEPGEWCTAGQTDMVATST